MRFFTGDVSHAQTGMLYCGYFNRGKSCIWPPKRVPPSR
ncbi:rmlB domain protein [Mycobacterium xenopi 4042]|uniref:RmlB domain protein n=1 Tax=Mycobacterium xenopi 4042 TaxID=1299334 RepID=X8CKE0_MYCXE|nr:rmlB domain protein [Mycobacterium xenopi 4042]